MLIGKMKKILTTKRNEKKPSMKFSLCRDSSNGRETELGLPLSKRNTSSTI